MKTVICAKMGLLVGVVASLLLTHQAAKGDFVFGEPTLVPGLNSSSADWGPSITADGLELYFSSNRDHGIDMCYHDIWVAKRATANESWGTPINLGAPVNTSVPESNPCVSADGLELYFSDMFPDLYLHFGCEPRPGGYVGGDLWLSTRETRDDPWGTPVNLGPTVNSPYYDDTPHISADGLSLYFSSQRLTGANKYGATHLFVATRKTKDDPWSPPVDLGPNLNNLGGVAWGLWLSYPCVSSDALSLIFSGAGSYVPTQGDIFVSRRATVVDPWGPPTPLPAISTASHEEGVIISASDSMLYFDRGDPFRTGSPDPALVTCDLWQVKVTPQVDFNGDGIVSVLDVLVLVENWGVIGARNGPKTSLCDVAPFPFGDDVVDAMDLLVLAEHMIEDVESVSDMDNPR
jgi:hypothetical protein